MEAQFLIFCQQPRLEVMTVHYMIDKDMSKGVSHNGELFSTDWPNHLASDGIERISSDGGRLSQANTLGVLFLKVADQHSVILSVLRHVLRGG